MDIKEFVEWVRETALALGASEVSTYFQSPAKTVILFRDGNKSVFFEVCYNRQESSFRWQANCTVRIPGFFGMDLTNVRIFQKVLAKAEAFMDQVEVKVASDAPWGFSGTLVGHLFKEAT